MQGIGLLECKCSQKVQGTITNRISHGKEKNIHIPKAKETTKKKKKKRGQNERGVDGSTTKQRIEGIESFPSTRELFTLGKRVRKRKQTTNVWTKECLRG